MANGAARPANAPRPGPLPARPGCALGAALLLLGGCSLGNPTRRDCAGPAECRALFGAGFTCDGASGLCVSVLSPECPEIFPEEAADDPEAILLGTIFDRGSPNQRARERAARLAVLGIDERNGVDGRPVALLTCDAAPATVAADHLVDVVGVPAIIGPSSSSETEAVFSSHRDAGVFVISPAATAVQLRDIDPGDPGRLWRTAPPDDLQAQVVLDELSTARPSRVAIVARQNDTYAQSLSVLLQSTLEGRDGFEVGATPQFAETDGVAAAADAALQDPAPDAVLFLSFRVADAAAFLEATAARPAYDGVRLLFTDAAANEELLQRVEGTAAAARLGQVRLTRPSAPDTILTSEFVASYRAAYDEDPLQFSFTAHAYDATAMVLLGVGLSASGGVVTGDGIAAGVERLSGGPQVRELLPSSFTAAIEDLRAGRTLDVVGASGELDYDPVSEELVTATYEVLRVEGGAFVVERSVTVP